MNAKRTPMLSLICTLLWLPVTFSEAASVTVTVVYSESEQYEYVVEDLETKSILLPIETTRPLLFSADWSVEESKKLYVWFKDPAVIVPGLAGVNSTAHPGPLTVFSVTLPFSPGTKQLVLRAPAYSVWFRFDEDKE